MDLKYSVKQSIDWFFETEEYGIILEDDVVPNLSFFNFVEHCLIKYQYNPEIVMISGNQFLPYNMIDEPYYFSSIFRIWGWATWKRAWLNIDLVLDNWDINQKNKLRRKYKKSFISGYIDQIVFSCKNQEVNTLDYPWWISGIMMDGLSIVPSKNLVSNIGNYGTHFHSADSVMLFMATDELNMSDIKSFNPVISQNSVYDSEEYKKFFFKPFYTGVGIKILKFTKLFSIARYIYKQIWRVKTN